MLLVALHAVLYSARPWRAAAALSATTAAILLAGHPQLVYQTAVLALATTVGFAYRRRALASTRPRRGRRCARRLHRTAAARRRAVRHDRQRDQRRAAISTGSCSPALSLNPRSSVEGVARHGAGSRSGGLRRRVREHRVHRRRRWRSLVDRRPRPRRSSTGAHVRGRSRWRRPRAAVAHVGDRAPYGRLPPRVRGRSRDSISPGRRRAGS